MIRLLSYLNLCACFSTFKLLFLKSYVSTDFDVHRNWMAITYNLPIKDWYRDTTSEWTLDYPPLFAAFEFFLALIAHHLNLSETLALTKEIVRTENTIVYQKVTVIIADFVYYYGVYKLCVQLQRRFCHDKEAKSQCLLDAIYRPDTFSCMAILLILQPGLLLVDHIHFQYNGLLSGVFLLSIERIVSRNYISGSLLFAILLNLKHIYLYCAPAYGIYLLTSHCLTEKNQSRVRRFLELAIVVSLAFILTYLPFADRDTIEQILRRLFPFKRGLTHAYWAPNIWSLYNTADKVLTLFLGPSDQHVDFDLDSISGKKRISSTSGLVQEYEHQRLYSVKPIATFILVGLLTIPPVIKLLLNMKKSSAILFIKSVTLTAFTAFMFGWHVHEKAVLVLTLPLVAVCFIEPNLRPILMRVILVGTYSLLPLLFQPAEYLTKITILVAYYSYARSLETSTGRKATGSQSYSHHPIWSKIYNLVDKMFVLALILIEIYITLVHGKFNYKWNPLAKLKRYDFLPLMLISSFSGLGMTVSYFELYKDLLFCKVE